MAEPERELLRAAAERWDDHRRGNPDCDGSCAARALREAFPFVPEDDRDAALERAKRLFSASDMLFGRVGLQEGADALRAAHPGFPARAYELAMQRPPRPDKHGL